MSAVHKRSRPAAFKTLVRETLVAPLGVNYQLKAASARQVLLTFDDGPHPEVTPAVLARLAAVGARAVFFVVGSRIDKAPHLLADILEAGHLIGNHSHAHWIARPPAAAIYVEDLLQCQRRIEALTGHRPRLFRPPLGHLSPGCLMAARAHRLKIVHWSLDSGDWQLRDSARVAECAERLLGNAAPRDIVLMHDDNPFVPEVLDAVLGELSDRGFDLTTAIDTL